MALEYILLIYAGGLAFIIAEVFLPGGFLGVIGTIALAVSIYFGFSHSFWLGGVLLVIALVGIPLAFYWGLKRLKLSSALKTEEGFRSPSPQLEKLVGKEGISYTPLRPAGTAVIEGKKIDVVTEGGMIDKDTSIKVIKVEGVRVIVRAR